eukprot:722503-Pyramimonas_sp.AAC.1
MSARAPTAKASNLRQLNCKPHCCPMRCTACMCASADAPEVASKIASLAHASSFTFMLLFG